MSKRSMYAERRRVMQLAREFLAMEPPEQRAHLAKLDYVATHDLRLGLEAVAELERRGRLRL